MAKPTIGELLAGKGKRQLTMTNATDYNTALAAAEAGIDIISGRGMYDEQQIGLVLDQIVKAAPNAVIAVQPSGDDRLRQRLRGDPRGDDRPRPRGGHHLFVGQHAQPFRGDGRASGSTAAATSASSRPGRAAKVDSVPAARRSTRRSGSTRRRSPTRRRAPSSSRWNASRPTSRPRSASASTSS